MRAAPVEGLDPRGMNQRLDRSRSPAAHFGPQLPEAHPWVAWPFVKHCAEGVQQWSLHPRPRNDEKNRVHEPRPLSHAEPLPQAEVPHDEPQLPQEVLQHAARFVWQTG